MKRIALALAIAAMSLLTACSSGTTRIEERGNGTCVQVNEKTTLGISRKTENIVRCP